MEENIFYRRRLIRYGLYTIVRYRYYTEKGALYEWRFRRGIEFIDTHLFSWFDINHKGFKQTFRRIEHRMIVTLINMTR